MYLSTKRIMTSTVAYLTWNLSELSILSVFIPQEQGSQDSVCGCRQMLSHLRNQPIIYIVSINTIGSMCIYIYLYIQANYIYIYIILYTHISRFL